MPGWMKHKLESRLPGEISITSDMQMTPPLWKKRTKEPLDKMSGAALGITDKMEARPQPPLLIPQAWSWDEGVKFCDSDLFFPFFPVELARNNVKVLIVLDRSMRKHKAFCSCAQKIIYKVTIDICSRIFTKNVPGWACRPKLEAMGRIVIWDLFVREMFMAKKFAEFKV